MEERDFKSFDPGWQERTHDCVQVLRAGFLDCVETIGVQRTRWNRPNTPPHLALSATATLPICWNGGMTRGRKLLPLHRRTGVAHIQGPVPTEHRALADRLNSARADGDRECPRP